MSNRFNGTSTQFRSLAPSLTRKAGTESPTVKESRRYINLANAILISLNPITASPFDIAACSEMLLREDYWEKIKKKTTTLQDDACVLKQCIMAFKVIQLSFILEIESAYAHAYGPILPRFRDIAGFLFSYSPWTRLPMLWLREAKYLSLLFV